MNKIIRKTCFPIILNDISYEVYNGKKFYNLKTILDIINFIDKEFKINDFIDNFSHINIYGNPYLHNLYLTSNDKDFDASKTFNFYYFPMHWEESEQPPALKKDEIRLCFYQGQSSSYEDIFMYNEEELKDFNLSLVDLPALVVRDRETTSESYWRNTAIDYFNKKNYGSLMKENSVFFKYLTPEQHKIIMDYYFQCGNYKYILKNHNLFKWFSDYQRMHTIVCAFESATKEDLVYFDGRKFNLYYRWNKLELLQLRNKSGDVYNKYLELKKQQGVK